jgi:hypothetical protein
MYLVFLFGIDAAGEEIGVLPHTLPEPTPCRALEHAPLPKAQTKA